MNKDKIKENIKKEKTRLKTKIKGLEPADQVKETIQTILIIENMLIDHLDKIEKYYIDSAKNINKIHSSLKQFFKKS